MRTPEVSSGSFRNVVASENTVQMTGEGLDAAFERKRAALFSRQFRSIVLKRWRFVMKKVYIQSSGCITNLGGRQYIEEFFPQERMGAGSKS